MRLYDLTGEFVDLFDRFDEIDTWQPDTDENGRPIDNDGNVIENVSAVKESMLTAWFDTLDGIEELFEDKAVNVALAIKNLKSEVAQLKAEKQKIAARQSQKEKAVKRLEKYLLESMQAIGRTKIDSPKALIKIMDNPDSTVVENEKAFITWAENNGYLDLLKYSDPDIRIIAVKQLLKSEVKLPYVHLERKKKIDIK